jgi:c-di-AMP phosphodiesterase-like protein
MFGGDMEMYVKKYGIISKAKEIAPGISLAVINEQVERDVASMAADEMMGIARMKASVVVFGEGNGCAVSARSYGDVNVQVLMEKIGGGGSLNMAGAQFPTEKPEQVELKLRAAIEEYLRESQPQEVNV